MGAAEGAEAVGGMTVEHEVGVVVEAEEVAGGMTAEEETAEVAAAVDVELRAMTRVNPGMLRCPRTLWIVIGGWRRGWIGGFLRCLGE